MRNLACLMFVACCGSCLAQIELPATPTYDLGASVAQTTVIRLGAQVQFAVAPPPRSPTTVPLGSRLELTATTFGISDPVVTWYKDSRLLSATGLSLVIAQATAADTGRYQAVVAPRGQPNGFWTTDVSVFVAMPGPRLLNVSNLGRVQPGAALKCGFIVEAAADSALILVRGVGPTLSRLGVDAALARPQIVIRDSAGRSVAGRGWQLSRPNSDAASQPLGILPLTPGSHDVADFFLLSPGAYVAELSSVDGGSGVALLEIYQAPVELISAYYVQPVPIATPLP